MKRAPLYLALLLLAATSASEAAADGGPGPLGVTTAAVVSAEAARVGALFVDGEHFCTASVVRSPGRDLIVTAAHCLDEDAGTDDFVFVPGYRDGRSPYGRWRITERYLPDGWTKGRDEDSDLAFAGLAEQHGRHIEDVVGGNRFTPGTATGATAVTVTGYPNSRATPVRCTNKPVAHSRTQQRIDCPGFSAGTSGSPWVNGDGDVVGVLGGHEQGGATDDISYSVVLGAEAAELYRRAAN
ncbi:trypsin-like peptidase domain-containing protein [Streptomyces sp. S.PB5]|uniref:trypsin-like serine peptidase n=1 Tax=Streptomyces sp. S.PB5 TaxID=3020844 RepID=UPI0025B1BD58|nr:trypsin-like peptidase domain-containing protein [Streptomyces sp. S.PB5]MDN3028812.1 trypsin-like peptidase domain-containing protein [Streptomyces sp. S.PB5]